jgi:cyclic di-GMP phosphodiesterase
VSRRVLVVDDEQVIRELIAEILVDAGYDVVAAADAGEALELLEDERIEIVVSDIVMPGMTGLELLEEVRTRRPSLPVVLVTGAGTHAMLTDALAGGAAGLVMKPFSHAELARAVATALERAGRAERDVRERLLTPALAGALANAIESRDSTMQGHCERISQLATRIAQDLDLSAADVDAIRLGALLHDVGKIGIPERVLTKHGPLSREERSMMETHPLIGDRLLEPLDVLAPVRPIVRHHHERWDGTGYPDRLAGDEIPRAARIVAVADSVEAMSGNRPYRTPFATEEIVRELEQGRGTQWEPQVVDVVLELIRSGELRFGPNGLGVTAPGEPAPPEPEVAVLLVEDDPDHALLAKEALESGHMRTSVTHVNDIASAMNLCRGATWSLVVLDHHLPDGNGLDLVCMLRNLAPDLPLVMLTGEGSEHLAVEAFRHGVSDYVVKSNGFLPELSSRVQALLRS